MAAPLNGNVSLSPRSPEKNGKHDLRRRRPACQCEECPLSVQNYNDQLTLDDLKLRNLSSNSYGDSQSCQSSPSRSSTPMTPDFSNSSPSKQEFELLKLREKTEALKRSVIEHVEKEITIMTEGLLKTFDGLDGDRSSNGNFSSGRNSPSKSKDHAEAEKVFIHRRSLLTELLEINHIKTIYHIFVAILILFIMNTIATDLVEKGNFDVRFDLMMWSMGRFPHVLTLWCAMQLAVCLLVFPAFHHWAAARGRLRSAQNLLIFDIGGLVLYACFQLSLLIVPFLVVLKCNMPPASSLAVACEQVRFIMKTHAFVREGINRAIKYKDLLDKGEKTDEIISPCPEFGNFLYFLFAPTLIYRDSYPRTATVHWDYVITNFAQVVACLFYTYYIFIRFCVPVFRNFSHEHMTVRALLLSVFACMLPGTLVLFIAFFAILHSWMNAFAEMLRFGDRMFYRDWWNSSTFANYYRTWNVIVHDWLYVYVYKDFYRLCPTSRPTAMAIVFLLSAVVHEYILILAFQFFYPVLFVLFAGTGFGLTFFLPKCSRSGNVFMWVALFVGTGLLMCLYSQEWYARHNCPPHPNYFLDHLIPRSWFCTPDDDQ